MNKIIIYLLFISSMLFSQDENIKLLTGSLVNDTQIALSEIQKNDDLNIKITNNKKTPILAALMSFAVPGAGQIYTENYLKAGIFVAIEVSAVLLAIKYNSKGDDQTDYFESYAQENWSVDRYANWTINKASTINPEVDPTNFNVYDNEGNVNWTELNNLENAIGSYYSHKLAPFDDQQYYEMIGKYPQFNVGWVEFGDDVNKSFVYGDKVVDQFEWYSKERGKANDYYNVAKWSVIAIVSNHFISAIEAAWAASKYNKKINLNISIEEETLGYDKEYYPQLNLSLKL